VLYCSGRHIVIKPLQASSKQVKWKAHEGTILGVDWNPINNYIISGGEDCRYKVWDAFGRLLYVSKQAFEFPITSVKWAPSGSYFAVGSFNCLTLADATGWVHSRSTSSSGSILSIDWTADGTQLAGAGANGAVVFGQVVDRSCEWKNFSLNLNETNTITVRDMLSLADGGAHSDELDFGERVIDLSMAYGQAIVVTARACQVSNFCVITSSCIYITTTSTITHTPFSVYTAGVPHERVGHASHLRRAGLYLADSPVREELHAGG
jgi:intraflagellar transport protein 80